MGISLHRDRVYRFLDTLDKNKLTSIAYEFVSVKNEGISLIFYDVTTLHFETETEDDFRKKGFSKDHRGDMPQILIGLFVDYEGYPFDFDFFTKFLRPIKTLFDLQFRILKLEFKRESERFIRGR